ncbi:MAG TPA: hypothetical protein VIA64_13605 [Burkholderiales bacterium]
MNRLFALEPGFLACATFIGFSAAGFFFAAAFAGTLLGLAPITGLFSAARADMASPAARKIAAT